MNFEPVDNIGDWVMTACYAERVFDRERHADEAAQWFVFWKHF